MSSVVVINTLKFCTCNVDEIKYALKVLHLDFSEECDRLVIGTHEILQAGQSYYMEVINVDQEGLQLFDIVNKKLAEIAATVKRQQIKENQREQEEARQKEEMYRVRQLRRQEEELEYEKKQLELEQESFVSAKKQAIIIKAKEMGYSVQETQENGKVKLKLVKRIY